MGLLQSACETYDCMKHKIGEYEAGKDPLAPISHTVTRAKIEITLNEHGQFINAQNLGEKAPKIIIPETEDS